MPHANGTEVVNLVLADLRVTGYRLCLRRLGAPGLSARVFDFELQSSEAVAKRDAELQFKLSSGKHCYSVGFHSTHVNLSSSDSEFGSAFLTLPFRAHGF